MKRVVIKLKDGSYINLPADCIDLRNGLVMAWNGEELVVLTVVESVEICYLSEKGETLCTK